MGTCILRSISFRSARRFIPGRIGERSRLCCLGRNCLGMGRGLTCSNTVQELGPKAEGGCYYVHMKHSRAMKWLCARDIIPIRDQKHRAQPHASPLSQPIRQPPAIFTTESFLSSHPSKSLPSNNLNLRKRPLLPPLQQYPHHLSPKRSPNPLLRIRHHNIDHLLRRNRP